MSSLTKYNRQVLDVSKTGLNSSVSHKSGVALTQNLILQIKKLKQKD